ARENSWSAAGARTVRSLWMLTTAFLTLRTTSTTGVCRTFHDRAAGLGGSARTTVAVRSRTAGRRRCVLMRPLGSRREKNRFDAPTHRQERAARWMANRARRSLDNRPGPVWRERVRYTGGGWIVILRRGGRSRARGRRLSNRRAA